MNTIKIIAIITLMGLGASALSGQGLHWGMTNAVKQKIKELDRKVTDDPGNGYDYSATVRITGTAARGKPLSNKTVEIKGTAGSVINTVTDSNGKYSTDVPDNEFPFLLRVIDGTSSYYSISMKEGSCNIHTLTDLAIRNWYASRLEDIDDDFNNSSSSVTLPSSLDLSAIQSAIKNALNIFFLGAGVPRTDFDLLTSTFSADYSGFDFLLENLEVEYEYGQVRIVHDNWDVLRMGATDYLPYMYILEPEDINDDNLPNPPANLAATRIGTHTVTLSWDASTDNVKISGYLVYEHERQIAISISNFFTDYNAPASSAEYKVRSFDEAGNRSEDSEVELSSDSITSGDLDDPAVPVLQVPIVVSSSQIDITWTASSDAGGISGYNIYANGCLVDFTTGTSYSLTGLLPDRTYELVVVVFDKSGNSSDSNTVHAKTNP